jgi:hypothetical protein
MFHGYGFVAARLKPLPKGMLVMPMGILVLADGSGDRIRAILLPYPPLTPQIRLIASALCYWSADATPGVEAADQRSHIVLNSASHAEQPNNLLNATLQLYPGITIFTSVVVTFTEKRSCSERR